MAKAIKFRILFINEEESSCKVDVLFEGYSGAIIEVVGGVVPFKITNDQEINSSALMGLFESTYSISGVCENGFSHADFDSENYGDIVFNYYVDSVLMESGIIDPFEASQSFLPDGTHITNLSAESGLTHLKTKVFANVDGTPISGRLKLIEVIVKCLDLLALPNVSSIVSEVNIDTYVGANKVANGVDFFKRYIDVEAFKTSAITWMTAYEVLESICGGIVGLKYNAGSWVLSLPENNLKASKIITTYDSSGAELSSIDTTVTSYDIGNETVLHGGVEGKLFSKRELELNYSIGSLINKVPNPNFNRSGFDILEWTNEDSFASTEVGGSGTDEDPNYFQINGSVHSPTLIANETTDAEYLQSAGFAWKPFGVSGFATRDLSLYYKEDENLRLSLLGEYGSGVDGGRIQIIATFQDLAEKRVLTGSTATYTRPVDTTLLEFETRTLYYTAEGWTETPSFYSTGTGSIEEIELTKPPYRSSQGVKPIRGGYLYNTEGDTSSGLMKQYLVSPEEVTLSIRLFRAERNTYGESTAELADYTYFAKYLSVQSSIWIDSTYATTDGEQNKTYISNAPTDRSGNDSVSLNIYEPVAPYAYGSIYETVSSNEPITSYKALGEPSSTNFSLLVATSYLRSNDKRLHTLSLSIKRAVAANELFSYNGKIFRIIRLEIDARSVISSVELLEVNYSLSAISEKITSKSSSEVLSKGAATKAETFLGSGDFEQLPSGELKLKPSIDGITSFNPTGGFLNLKKEGNEDTSALNFVNESGIITDYLKPLTDGFYLKVEGGQEEKIATANTAWMLGGNTIGAKQSIGSLDAFDVGIIRGGIEKLSITSVGVEVSNRFKFSSATADVGNSSIIGVDAGSSKDLLFYDYENSKAWMRLHHSGNTVIGDLVGSRTDNGAKLQVLGDSYFGGNVGIKTETPQHTLDINSDIVRIFNTGSVELILEADTDNATETDNPKVVFKQDGGVVSGFVGYKTGTNDIAIYNNWTGGLSLGVDGSEKIKIATGGNVGLDTTNPTELLDVNGTARVTNLKITNGAAVGKVWQCDNANGSGTWVSPLTSERYKGDWDASSGTAPDASPTSGDYYVVNTAGTYSGTTYAAGDEIYYDGTSWLIRQNFLTLPTASAGTLGGVKVGSRISIASGVISADLAAWSDITGKPTTIAGYGITDYDSLWDAKEVSIYNNLAENKLVGYNNGGLVSMNATLVSSGAELAFGYGLVSFDYASVSSALKVSGSYGTNGQVLVSLGNIFGSIYSQQWTTLETSHISDWDTAWDAKIAAFIGSAPSALDTWLELVAEIENTESEVNGIITSVASLTSGLANVYTQSESDNKFVTLSTAQAITGAKGFIDEVFFAANMTLTNGKIIFPIAEVEVGTEFNLTHNGNSLASGEPLVARFNFQQNQAPTLAKIGIGGVYGTDGQFLRAGAYKDTWSSIQGPDVVGWDDKINLTTIIQTSGSFSRKIVGAYLCEYGSTSLFLGYDETSGMPTTIISSFNEDGIPTDYEEYMDIYADVPFRRVLVDSTGAERIYAFLDETLTVSDITASNSVVELQGDDLLFTVQDGDLKKFDISSLRSYMQSNLQFGNDANSFGLSDITGQNALTSGLSDASEFVINHNGSLKRMDASVLLGYVQDNLILNGSTTGLNSVLGIDNIAIGKDIKLATIYGGGQETSILFGDELASGGFSTTSYLNWDNNDSEFSLYTQGKLKLHGGDGVNISGLVTLESGIGVDSYVDYVKFNGTKYNLKAPAGAIDNQDFKLRWDATNNAFYLYPM